MTNDIIRVTVSICLALWLTACATSPPNSYYRLTPLDGLKATGQTPSLGIGPVEIPEYLNRRALVSNSGGTQLKIHNQERWAEPLDDGILRVVSLNLANLLNTQHLHYFPWDPRQAPDYSIRIKLLALEADDKEATLLAEWLVDRRDDDGVASDGVASDGVASGPRISLLKQSLPTGAFQPAQLPPAYSDLLYQLSELIAAEIRSKQAASAKKPGAADTP